MRVLRLGIQEGAAPGEVGEHRQQHFGDRAAIFALQEQVPLHKRRVPDPQIRI